MNCFSEINTKQCNYIYHKSGLPLQFIESELQCPWCPAELSDTMLNESLVCAGGCSDDCYFSVCETCNIPRCILAVTVKSRGNKRKRILNAMCSSSNGNVFDVAQ